MDTNHLLFALVITASAGTLTSCETYESGTGQKTNPRLRTTPQAAQPVPDISLEGREMVDHTVVAGDTLWELGRDYKVQVDDIKVANGLTDDVIRIGQSLKIPLPEGTKVSSLEELPPPGEPPADPTADTPSDSSKTGTPPPLPPPSPTNPAGVPDPTPNASPPGSAGGPPLESGLPTPPPPPPGDTGGGGL